MDISIKKEKKNRNRSTKKIQTKYKQNTENIEKIYKQNKNYIEETQKNHTFISTFLLFKKIKESFLKN